MKKNFFLFLILFLIFIFFIFFCISILLNLNFENFEEFEENEFEKKKNYFNNCTFRLFWLTDDYSFKLRNRLCLEVIDFLFF
jgi:hypothetical protein